MSFLGQAEWSGSNGIGFSNTCFKRKFRWQFIIPDVSAYGVNSLPPLKGGRPSINFKEMQAEHLNETIFFPSKPEWRPITLTLYDVAKADENPVFSWIKRAYNPTECSYWKPCLETAACPYSDSTGSFKCAQAFLVQYDGCGSIMEEWVFEHVWPQTAEFLEGDMASSDIQVCDLTLRYDRAYISTPNTATPLTFSGILPNYNCSAIPVVSMTAFAAVAPLAEFAVIRD